MKKSVLAIALAVLMAVSLLTVGAMADGTGSGTADDPYVINSNNISETPTILSQGGYIRLDVSVTVTGSSTEHNTGLAIGKTGTETHLDLNGNSIKLANSGGKMTFAIPYGNVTITDSSEVQTGSISSANSIAVVINNKNTLNIESGTFASSGDYEAIYNSGTLNISGGVIKGSSGVSNNVTDVAGDPVRFNMSGGTIDAEGYGLCLFGAGLPGMHYNQSGSSIRNDLLIANVSGSAKISGNQGVATNASSGKYAGFTLTVSGGTITGTAMAEDDGCGMYLPAIGVTNITGGTITGAQGIRFCSGELNITGGTIVGTASLEEDTDLIAGGSGGTAGAIVVGKAGAGYVGDAILNISDGAVIKNTATSEAGEPIPAIVVSDKNMSNSSYGYDTLSISVNVGNGATVIGDILKVPNLTTGTVTSDGGKTSLIVDGATVTGNVINQTSAGDVVINRSQISGNIVNESASGKVAVIKSTAQSTSGNVAVVDSVIGEDNVTTPVDGAVASVNGVTYDSLTEALADAKAGNTVYLLNDVEIDAALAIPAGVTLDGNDFTIEASEAFSGSYLINLNNGDLSNVKIMDVVLDGNNKASILLKVGDGAVCSGLTVSGVTLKNATHGVYLGNDSGSQNAANNISFTDCTFEDLSYAGIYAQRGNIAVDQCKFQNIASASSTAAGVLFDTGYFDGREYSLSVTNSTFTNITGTSSNEKATGGVSITGTGTVSKLTVTGNTFSGNTIDIRLGKTTAPVISDANIAGNGIVNIVAAPGVGLYTAKFYSNNALVATVVSDETGKITIPAAPSNSGYIFLGWRSGDATYKAGEVVTITADTTFVAVWGNLPDVKPSEPETPETPVFPFYDVTARDWYYSAVKYVYEKGLMDGVDVGVFAPNDTLTRAMVWTIIARAEGVDTTGGATWYAKAQEWVTAKGISDGENPTAAITRQELVTMLYRLAGEPAVSGTITAPDAASVSTWAQSAMTWAMNIGLVEGDENGAVTPTATATRAQAAALIMRYLEA